MQHVFEKKNLIKLCARVDKYAHIIEMWIVNWEMVPWHWSSVSQIYTCPHVVYRIQLKLANFPASVFHVYFNSMKMNSEIDIILAWRTFVFNTWNLCNFIDVWHSFWFSFLIHVKIGEETIFNWIHLLEVNWLKVKWLLDWISIELVIELIFLCHLEARVSSPQLCTEMTEKDTTSLR